MMRGIDWFAGVGGYTVAMRRAGIEVVGACERDQEKRAHYAAACAPVPDWFGEDCHAPQGAPNAGLWTACAGVPDILRWLPETRPRWLLMETVRMNVPELLVAVLWRGEVSIGPAGQRVFVIVGPSRVTLPRLPMHDGQGPESDPVALDLVLAAIRERS